MEMMGYDLAIDLHNTTRSQIIRRGFITTNNVHIRKPRWNRFKLFAFHKNDFPNNFTVRTWLHEPIQHLLPKNFTIEQSQLFVSAAEKSGINNLSARNGLKMIVGGAGGFTYAKQKIDEFNHHALDAISPYPDSPYKQSMVDLISFNAQRTG
jgi:ADP-heptose:LPS heptosyltransferase